MPTAILGGHDPVQFFPLQHGHPCIARLCPSPWCVKGCGDVVVTPRDGGVLISVLHGQQRSQMMRLSVDVD